MKINLKDVAEEINLCLLLLEHSCPSTNEKLFIIDTIVNHIYPFDIEEDYFPSGELNQNSYGVIFIDKMIDAIEGQYTKLVKSELQKLEKYELLNLIV